VFRLQHAYIILSIALCMVYLLCALRSGFVQPATAIERPTIRFVFLRLSNLANLFALVEIFIEQIQLSGLAYLSAHAAWISYITDRQNGCR
jgi:hypothetical protein